MLNEVLLQQLKHSHLRDRAIVEPAENRDETPVAQLMNVMSDRNVLSRRTAAEA